MIDLCKFLWVILQQNDNFKLDFFLEKRILKKYSWSKYPLNLSWESLLNNESIHKCFRKISEHFDVCFQTDYWEVFLYIHSMLVVLRWNRILHKFAKLPFYILLVLFFLTCFFQFLCHLWYSGPGISKLSPSSYCVFLVWLVSSDAKLIIRFKLMLKKF